MQAQVSLLSFGAAALAFVFAAASTAANAEFRDLFFLILAPLLCYLIVIIWFAEVSRTMRAGAFLMQLERRLDKDFGVGAITWESALFEARTVSGRRAILEDPDRLRNLAVTVLFLGIAGTSITIGWDAAPGWSWQRIVAIAALAACVLVLLRLRALRQQQQERLFRPAREGDVGEHVAKLQGDLYRVGVYHGRLDGNYGAKTREAVEAFQVQVELPKDGVAGPITWSHVDAKVDEHETDIVENVTAGIQRARDRS